MHRVENLVNESCEPGNRRLKCRDMGTGSQLRMLTTDLAPPIIGLVNVLIYYLPPRGARVVIRAVNRRIRRVDDDQLDLSRAGIERHTLSADAPIRVDEGPLRNNIHGAIAPNFSRVRDALCRRRLQPLPDPPFVGRASAALISRLPPPRPITTPGPKLLSPVLGRIAPRLSKKSDGSFVGRSAPEIDVFEATIGGPDTAHIGQVSQTARRAVGDQNCYQLKGQCFSTYGFEYKPGYADPLSLLLHKLMDAKYISWITDDKLLWTMNSNMVCADTATEIGARQVPVEPMYIIMNLGFSENFGFIDFDHLTFPAVMRVDWVGCNPADYPTADYINQYMEAYTNANLTTWVGFPPGYTQE
ncbi:beta-glucan synthesis-associated protein-domain-containing protein [Mycena olivaceomarginata]|nr:beta-glucan synthesis-associated protein-domain-containing protein [Mycena olivaceomarginata]